VVPALRALSTESTLSTCLVRGSTWGTRGSLRIPGVRGVCGVRKVCRVRRVHGPGTGTWRYVGVRGVRGALWGSLEYVGYVGYLGYVGYVA